MKGYISAGGKGVTDLKWPAHRNETLSYETS